MENELGTLEAGKIANFMITSSPVFDADNIIYENWVHGSRYVINNLDFPDIRGIYQLQAEGLPDIEMTVSGSPVKPEVQVKTGEETAKATFGKTGELFIDRKSTRLNSSH